MSMSAKTVVPDIETCRPSVAKESARVLSRRVWLSCHKSFSLHRTSDVKLKHIMHIEADDFFDFLLWVKQVDWHGIYWASCWFCAELRKAVHVSKHPHGAARSATKNGQSRRVNTPQIATKTSNDLHRRLHTWVKTRMVFSQIRYTYIYLSIYHIYICMIYNIYIYIPNRSADIGTMPLQHRGSWLLASCKDWLRQMAPSDKCDQNWSSVFGKMMHRWKHVSRAWSLRSLFGKHSPKHSRHRSALCTHCGKVMAWMLPLLPPQFSHENSRLFFANLLCQWIQ